MQGGEGEGGERCSTRRRRGRGFRRGGRGGGGRARNGSIEAKCERSACKWITRETESAARRLPFHVCRASFQFRSLFVTA